MSGPDEELRVAPRRVPGGVVVLLCLAAAGLLVVALLHRGGDRRPSAAPSSPRTQTATGAAPTAARPSGSAPTTEYLGGRLALADQDAAVLDAAVGDGVLYVLEYGADGATLQSFDAVSRRPLRHSAVGGVEVALTPFLHLATGPDRVWVVAEGTQPEPVRAFDGGLRGLPSIAVPATIYGTAVLDGRLYLATAAGVMSAGPDTSTAVAVPGSDSLIAAVAADPTRHRVLAVDASAPLHVLALRPGGRVRQVATLQSLGVPTIAVAGGSVWLAGYSDAGTAVVQLDATTFEPNTVSSPAAGLAGPGARVIGGTRLWVVSGTPGFEQAWCVDAGTGAVRGYWTGIAGSITAYRGSIFAVTDDGVRFGVNATC